MTLSQATKTSYVRIHGGCSIESILLKNLYFHIGYRFTSKCQLKKKKVDV